MYTGIVQACLPVKVLEKKEGLYTFSVELDGELMEGLQTGASVAVNGVCFTVTKIDQAEVFFDVIKESLELSNLRLLEVGTMVNVERSAKSGDEVGGHILSGHVVGTSRVVRVESSENNRRLTFDGDPAWLKFVFEKGFLAVNGASLTVAKLDRKSSEYSINFIPETLERTNFSLLSEGDLVNVEIESQTQVIVETVERVMAERFADSSTA